MKKLAIILATILLIAVILVTAVACEKKDEQGRFILKTPVVTISGSTATWKSIRRATSYGVVANGADEIITKSNAYPYVGDGAFTIKVRAIGDNETTITSSYSAEVSSTVIDRMTRPSGVVVAAQESGSVKVTWDDIGGASAGYTVKLKFNNKTIATMSATNNEHIIGADQFANAGAYQVEVITRSVGAKVDSLPSEAVGHTHVVTLANPKQVLLSTSGIIKFAKIDNANKYYVRVLNVSDNKEVGLIGNPTVGSTEVTLDVKKFAVTEPGKYYYQVKASRDVVSSYYNDSEWVDVKLKEADTTRAELALLAAPTDFTLDADGKTLRWKAVEGAEKYTIKMISNTKTYIAETDKIEYDLSTNTDMTSNSNGGKTVEITIYAKENYEKGYMAGLVSDGKVEYNFIKTPKKIESSDIYAISSLPELMYISREPNAKYKLTADINVDKGNIYGITSTFGGEFDGNYKTINNFNLVPRVGEEKLSLFGEIAAGAVVKNLTLLQNEIKVKSIVINGGALIAVTNRGTVENITAAAAIEIEGEVGGLVINNYGTIKGANVDIDITGYDIVGGIVADNKQGGSIVNSKIYTSVIKAQSAFKSCYAGAVAAKSSGTITNTGASGSKITVTAQGKEDGHNAYLGALVGMVDGGTVTGCYTSGSGELKAYNTGVKGSAFAGAFIGHASNTAISKVYNTGGNIFSTHNVGGFMAYLGSNATLSDGYSAISKIEGKQYAGLIYDALGTITNFHYAKYDLPTMKITSSALAEGNVTGVSKVDQRSMMKSITALSSVGFRFTTDVNEEFMILSSVPYIGKVYEFNRGNIKYTDKRTEFAKVYYGDKVIDAPTTQVSSDIKGYRADIYDVEGFFISRIMYVN